MTLRSLAPEASASAIPPHPHVVFNCFALEEMVRVTGLEPVRRLTHAPQTCLSTSSSTLAFPIVSESPRSQRQELLYQRLPHLSTQYSDFLKKILRQVYGQSFHLPCPYPPAAPYAPNRICSRSLSAIIEINSLFVGFPLTPDTV